MSVSGHDNTISLMGRLASAAARGRLREVDPHATVMEEAPLPALTPLPLADALVDLAGRCGASVTREGLTAAMPLVDGDLDPRFAPAAFARAGLEAKWERVAALSIRDVDLPALGLLSAGGCVLLVARRGRDFLEIRDAAGEQIVPIWMLTRMMEPRILVCGHVDPENGLSSEEEAGLARRNPLLWLLGLFMGERRHLKHLLGAAALMNLTALALPLYMRAIYDRVVPNLAIESLWALSIGIVLVLSFELVLKKLRGHFVDAIGLRVGQAVQHRAMTAVLKARPQRSQASASGLMTALKDVEGLAFVIPQAIVTYLIDVPFFFGYLALIVMIGGWTVAGPVIGAGALLIAGLVSSYALKLAGKRSTKLMQARNDLVADVADGIDTIKANRAEGRMLRQWDIVSDHIGVSTQVARKWSEMPTSASGFLVQFVTVMVVIIGVLQIKSGMMTTGALVALTMLTGRAMMPISNAINVTSRLYQNLSQISGLAALLALEPERDVSDPSIRRGRISGDYGVRGFGYSYPGAKEPSLKDLGLTIRQGERVALIGRSGSGKSTLLRGLAGMIDPGEGAITLDGHALSQYSPAHLRQSVVYSAQDAALFNSSIWDNILLGIEEPSAEIVERAIKSSGVDSFVARSIEGYARNVGRGGSRLSGGQRQSVILARALIRDPRILLLDEPTAAMDINAERMVIEGLQRFAADGRTLVVATHRMAILDLVDRVIWLEDGRILADKPKIEVLAMMRNQNQKAA